MTRLALAILAALCVAASCAVLAPGVRAHGDAEWIERGKYRNPVTNESCCGRHDCEVVSAERVVLRGDGRYEVDGATIPLDQVLTSEDHQWWVCWRAAVIYQMYRSRSVRCLFAPVRG